MSNELYHHGVKGMKWGVRKQRRLQSNVRAAKKNYKNAGYGEKTIARVELSSSQRKLQKHQTKMSYKNDKQYRQTRNEAIVNHALKGIGYKVAANYVGTIMVINGKDAAGFALGITGNYMLGREIGTGIVEIRKAKEEAIKRNKK